MTEDEGDLLKIERDDTAGHLVLYDFFKHLTTVALLMLGGVLTIAQMSDRSDVKLPILIAVIALVAIGGGISFMGTSEIARASFAGEKVSPKLETYRKIVPAMLSFGVGIFIAMVVDALN